MKIWATKLFSVHVLLLAVSIAALSGCNKKAKARDYSNKMTDIETTLHQHIKEAEPKIGEYYKNQEWNKMDNEAKKMEDDIEQKLSEIKNEAAPDVPGAADYKKASVKYFTFLKTAYSIYRKIAKAETDQERDAELENLKKIYAQRVDVSNEMKEAQRKFADANGEKI